MAIIRSFREMEVYNLALKEAARIFKITKEFPKEERYSLTDQIRRSSRAVNALEYINSSLFDEIDDAWQHVGAMLNRVIQRADDFCKSASK